MITAERETQIHAAMEQAGGVASEAARLLGIPSRDLNTILWNNKTLRLRWTSAGKEEQAPTEAVTIHRPTIPVLKEDEEVADAMTQEDKLVKSGLEAIGLKPKALNVAMALQKYHNKHFAKSLEMIGGGITKQFIDLMMEVDELTTKINSGTVSEAKEMILREDRAKLLDLMSKFYDRANQAAITQAKIEAIRNAKRNPQTQKPRGFLAIQAQSGSTVNVNGTDDQA